MKGPIELRNDAIAIWRAGVDTVHGGHLVQKMLKRTADCLVIGGRSFRVDELNRIVVVGAGKASAAMAAGIERGLGGDPVIKEKMSGWINVPESCLQKLDRIHIHAARPAGANLPTKAGVTGAERILDLVRGLSDDDLCIALISGGGSALLPITHPGVKLDELRLTTQALMNRGVDIRKINVVRKQLSLLLGGGLARLCKAGQMVSLILSDIVGDPVDQIASGPTAPNHHTARDALEVLRDADLTPSQIPPSIFAFLQKQSEASESDIPRGVWNHVIGNNALALSAAENEAIRLGYRVQNRGTNMDGDARSLGESLARECIAIRNESDALPVCILSGGEPTVSLPAHHQEGRGGRNQHLVLAAFGQFKENELGGIAILSAGTDGEDGPTDAAGAFIDTEIGANVNSTQIDFRSHLERFDSYSFFEEVGGLLKIGVTHTNVMDVRVALIN